MPTKKTYLLNCHYKGAHDTFLVIVPRTANVNTLSGLIYQKREIVYRFHNLDPAMTDLILTKVEIDLRHLQTLSGLKLLNNSHQPICLFNPSMLISEIWEQPPPHGHLHVFMQFHTRKAFSTTYLTISPHLGQAAKRLYNSIWLKDLEKLLLDVPGYSGMKYLSGIKADDLQLPILGYSGEVLLVHKEYLTTLNALNMKANDDGATGGVAVTSQPGIDKSFFFYYTLLHRLSNGKPTAFQHGHVFLLFDQCGIGVYDTATTEWQFDFKEKIWALSDSNEISTQPCQAFLTFSQMGNAWIVQGTTLASDWWHDWYEKCKASFYVMKPFPPNELKALRSLIYKQALRGTKAARALAADYRLPLTWSDDLSQLSAEMAIMTDKDMEPTRQHLSDKSMGITKNEARRRGKEIDKQEQPEKPKGRRKHRKKRHGGTA